MPCNTTSGLPMLGCCGGVVTEGIVSKLLIVTVRKALNDFTNDLNDYIQEAFDRVFQLSFDDVDPQFGLGLVIDVTSGAEFFLPPLAAPGGANGAATHQDAYSQGSFYQFTVSRVLWISGPSASQPCVSIYRVQGPGGFPYGLVKECGFQELPYEASYTNQDGLIVPLSSSLGIPTPYEIRFTINFQGTPTYDQRPPCCGNPAP